MESKRNKQEVNELARVIYSMFRSDAMSRALASVLHSEGYRKVVWCKDCVYWQDNNGGYPHEECRWGKDETPDAYDYCSYGERVTK